MKKILLQEILPLDDLSREGSVLLIRHQRDFLDDLINEELLERYQSFQNKPAFKNCKFIVSFIAERNNQAKFYGLYEKTGLKEKEELPQYDNSVLEDKCLPQNKETDFYLILKKKPEFEKYKNRLIIDWVAPGIAWFNTYGNIKDKEVIKIQAPDFVLEFKGIMKIKVSANKLKEIIKARQKEWYEELTRLQAVYLILDKASGKQYVGTTYGKEGLWQRWSSYTNGDFTNDNKHLLKLKQKNKNFHSDLQFSVLEVLLKEESKKKCLKAETNWKEKLGSRAFGLNAN